VAAEADAEKRLVLLQRHANPVDLAFDEIDVVIGALRPAKNDRAGMVLQRRRQLAAKRRPADVERYAVLAQILADTAGRGIFLMQNDEDRQRHWRC
jgi:GTP cyclohydrolase II